MAKTSVAALEQFVEGFKAHPFVVGLDVHKRNYSVALLRVDGRVRTLVTPGTPKALISLVDRLGIKVSLTAQESGPTGFALARALEAKGVKVIVAAPSKIPRSITAGAKCDRLDCIKLAQFAARGMLKPIAIPTEEEQAGRCLLRRRHMVLDEVRRTKLRIKSLLLFLGVDAPKGLARWSMEGVNELSQLSLTPRHNRQWKAICES